MFKPQLIEGTAICRSTMDPALELPQAADLSGCSDAKPCPACAYPMIEADGCSACEARREAARIGKEHHESCGTSALPARAGDRLSEFEVRLLNPLVVRPRPVGDDAEQYCVEWYKLCIVSLDGITDRGTLLSCVPRQVMTEIGGYASRLNSRVTPPFSSSSQRKPSAARAGSRASGKSKSRKAGTRKRT